jgi:Cys-rich repeat protein
MHQVINSIPNYHSPQCDLKRQCYCTEDSHCAAGFKCVAALSFPEYRVCKAAGIKAMLG